MARNGVQYRIRSVVSTHRQFSASWQADRSRQTSDSQAFARVLYSGHALRTAQGTLDWVPLSDVVDQLKAHVPDDIIAMCKVQDI